MPSNDKDIMKCGYITSSRRISLAYALPMNMWL